MLVIGFLIVAILFVCAAGTALGLAFLKRAHRPAGRFVPVTGGTLHIVEIGPQTDDPPIVLLHGASGNLEDQRLTLGMALAHKRRVVLIDRPGHGFSDRPGGMADASPARQAALIDEALARIGVARAVIAGHSWSGALAATCALDFPARVAGLVLLAPVTHPWPGGISWYNRLAMRPVVGSLFVYGLALPLGLLLIGGALKEVFAPQLAPADYLRRAAARLVLRPAEFIANAQDVGALKAFVIAQAPRYREIAVPTVIITGDCDNTVSCDLHSRAMAALVPGAKLIVLDGVGHMLHHTSCDVIVAAINELTALARERRKTHSPLVAS